MKWLINPNNGSDNVCPKSACFTFDYCNKNKPCPKNTDFCFIEDSGPSCTDRSCVIYW